MLTRLILSVSIAGLTFAPFSASRAKMYQIVAVGCNESIGRCGFVESGRYKLGDETSAKPSDIRTGDKPILITYSEVIIASANKPTNCNPVVRGCDRRELKANNLAQPVDKIF
jgi:hypothetical protein